MAKPCFFSYNAPSAIHVYGLLFSRFEVSLSSCGIYNYTPLTKLLARWARQGRMHRGSGNHAEKYSSISATNQYQISSIMQRLNFGLANGEFRRPNVSVWASIHRVTIPNFQKSKNYSKTKVYKSQLLPTYHLY